VIYGTAYDDSLGDQLRVTVIATGLSPASRKQATPIQVVHSAPVQRTGTDNLPIMGHQHGHQQPVNVSQPAQAVAQDYSQLATPSVWRNPRTQAAAKVDALSANGMDEIEIPAFLRKQAD
jgi:cell division protein FtsZ